MSLAKKVLENSSILRREKIDLSLFDDWENSDIVKPVVFRNKDRLKAEKIFISLVQNLNLISSMSNNLRDKIKNKKFEDIKTDLDTIQYYINKVKSTWK